MLAVVHKCAYTAAMNFKWDPRKATANFSKHGVRFADAVAVFTDPQALTIEDLGRGEERYVTLGMDALTRVLVVAYTWRDDTIRLISARKATGSERLQYAEGKL
jgi:uncharacterized DUF497 family protein